MRRRARFAVAIFGRALQQGLVDRNIVQRHALGGKAILEAPPNGNVAPPGYYLLFILTAQGVPSEGRFIRIDQHPES